MDNYIKKVEVRWSDLDANYHLRHSVYYDWGAFVRLSFFDEHGLTMEDAFEYHIGPTLFREECVFKKEIIFGDAVTVNLKLSKCRKDASRWSIVHEVWKKNDILSAVITADGAWIDTQIRKLAVPPLLVKELFEEMPKTNDFEWL